jgi:hypothetical protein
MKIYRFRVHPNIDYALTVHRTPLLTRDAIIEALPDATVRELTSLGSGHYIVDVQLQRLSHEEALNEIIAVLWNLGFGYLEATVSDWTSEAVGRAVVGLLGGGAVSAPSENSAVIFLAGIVGAVIAGLTGRGMHKLRAEYEVLWDRQQGCWTLSKLPPRQQPQQRLRPGVSLA